MALNSDSPSPLSQGLSCNLSGEYPHCGKAKDTPFPRMEGGKGQCQSERRKPRAYCSSRESGEAKLWLLITCHSFHW